MTEIFIDGREGTTGLRIFERLSLRKDVSLIVLPEDKRKDIEYRRQAINDSDITFLCLPDAAAREAVGLAESDVKIIDASTAHRTEPTFAYGFPELGCKFREKIASGNRIAVPGCHASGFLSIVYPLVKCGIIPKDYPVCCHSLTGYSGGGKKMIKEYEEGGNEFLLSPRQYGIGQTHKHLKEMKHVSGLCYEPYFSPIVADFYSGMEVTVPLFSRLLGNVTLNEVYSALKSHYENSRLIEVVGAEEFPDGFVPANYLSGADNMKIVVTGNDERINVISLFDNLGKGASGAAVQCLNIAMGLEETTGLTIK